jgi:predicted Na+-dependent transporter
MKFSRNVFLIAGIYGLLVVTPQYFMESRVGRTSPPPVTHPEYFYGFVGAVVVWHVLFLVISRDPSRYRAMMPVAALEKLAFGAPILVLYAQGRAALPLVGAAVIDLILGALFLLSFWKTAEHASDADYRLQSSGVALPTR